MVGLLLLEVIVCKGLGLCGVGVMFWLGLWMNCSGV